MRNLFAAYMSFCLAFALAAACAAFLSCGTCPQPDRAGATETGHVTGMLYAVGGSAARDAQVHLRHFAALADTSGVSVDVALAKTDTNGRFAMDNVDTGLYVIEGIDKANNRAIIDSVQVVDETKGNNPVKDTLKPVGAIKGKIILSEGGDPAKVLVLVYGTDKLSWAGKDGSFKVDDCAEKKNYKLRILPLLPEYNALDTGAIDVLSAETTDAGTISLVFTGVPAPKNLALSYDSLKQIVRVSWTRPNSNKNFKGFTVYRRDVDSNTAAAAISRGLLADTVFRDSTGVAGRTYEYTVACVDTLGNPGKTGAGKTLTVTSVIKILSAWGDSGAGPGRLFYPQKMAIDDSGYVYVVDNGNKRVRKFTAGGAFVLQFADAFELVSAICTDKRGTVFIADLAANRVYAYSSGGAAVFSIGTPTEQYKGVTVDENGDLYVLGVTNSKGFIRRYDSLGNAGESWQTDQGDMAMRAGAGPDIYTCRRNVISDYSKTGGSLLSSWTIPGGAEAGHNASDIVISAAGNVIVTDIETDQLLVFSPAGALIARGGSFGNITGLAMDRSGNLYGAESGKNRIVKIKYQ
jgi:sugar lactone lactonase YvrE